MRVLSILRELFQKHRRMLHYINKLADHPDLQQIVIALMVTPQRSPFYWNVHEGNTQDVTTLLIWTKDFFVDILCS
ncbi:hypothetical protein [Desulfosporosinus metallidurans]|uniref:Mobile element protein n=1 Tax=Desulfosporosinus metallidurans TaxID=1888891 RepID=A0A1Q8QXT7_9FIRM|nr:hypothetical protein [Desulfosporosinus metallidurans]OLN32141.1 Mobile element protein [Desulfosporosinus metallidurans]